MWVVMSKVAVSPLSQSEPGDVLEVVHPPLGADQQAIMDLLQSGKSIQETAQMVGISRQTFYRWLKSDPAFRAAYNKWQNEIEETTYARLLALSEVALDSLEKAIRSGDVKAVSLLFRVLDRLRSKSPKLSEAEDVREWMDLQERQRKVGLKQAKKQVAKAEEMAAQM